MEEARSKEKKVLNDAINKEITEEKEEHDVHAEGKVCEKNSKSPHDSPEVEHKALEPGGDATDNGSADESLEHIQIHKSEDKNEGDLRSNNSLIDENTESENFTKSKNVKKSQKLEKYAGFESLPKNIGDRKQVKFIVKDVPKFSGDKAQRAKERGTRNVYTAGKGLESKRQDVAGKDNSPQRDKPKEKTNASSKKRDIPKKEDDAKPEVAEDSDENDSGEEYWSKSTGESTIKLDTNPEAKGEAARSRPKLRHEAEGRAGARKRVLRRSASAEHRKGLASAATEATTKDEEREEPRRDHDTALEGSNRDNLPLSIDLADVDGSESDEEGCPCDTENIDTANSGTTLETQDILLAEKLPLPVSDALKETECSRVQLSRWQEGPLPAAGEGPAERGAPAAAAAAWGEWLGQLVDAFAHAGCYRASLCLGWLLWAAWILRLMGFKGVALGGLGGLGGLAGALGQCGLVEFVGVVEVLGLLQVMWLLWHPPALPAPATTPTPATETSTLPAPHPPAGSAPDLSRDMDLGPPAENSSERAIADTIL